MFWKDFEKTPTEGFIRGQLANQSASSYLSDCFRGKKAHHSFNNRNNQTINVWKKKGRNDYENGRGKSMSSVCSTQFTYKQSWPEENRWRDPARAHNQKKGAKHWKKEREREIIKGTNGIIHLSQQPANNKKCNCWFSGSENPIARIVDHYDMKCLFFLCPWFVLFISSWEGFIAGGPYLPRFVRLLIRFHPARYFPSSTSFSDLFIQMQFHRVNIRWKFFK